MRVFVWMSMILFMEISPRALIAGSEKFDFVIPPENQRDTERPDFATFEKTARLLIDAINQEKSEMAKPAFFPEDIFTGLKDIPRPGEYYQKLLKNFYLDMAVEFKKIKTGEKYEYASFIPGRCIWKKVGSEYNKIAYWSCHKNQIKVNVGNRAASVTIVSLINWGPDWYVTHLGRMR